MLEDLIQQSTLYFVLCILLIFPCLLFSFLKLVFWMSFPKTKRPNAESTPEHFDKFQYIFWNHHSKNRFQLANLWADAHSLWREEYWAWTWYIKRFHNIRELIFCWCTSQIVSCQQSQDSNFRIDLWKAKGFFIPGHTSLI